MKQKCTILLIIATIFIMSGKYYSGFNSSHIDYMYIKMSAAKIKAPFKNETSDDNFIDRYEIIYYPSADKCEIAKYNNTNPEEVYNQNSNEKSPKSLANIEAAMFFKYIDNFNKFKEDGLNIPGTIQEQMKKGYYYNAEYLMESSTGYISNKKRTIKENEILFSYHVLAVMYWLHSFGIYIFIFLAAIFILNAYRKRSHLTHAEGGVNMASEESTHNER